MRTIISSSTPPPPWRLPPMVYKLPIPSGMSRHIIRQEARATRHCQPRLSELEKWPPEEVTAPLPAPFPGLFQAPSRGWIRWSPLQKPHGCPQTCCLSNLLMSRLFLKNFREVLPMHLRRNREETGSAREVISHHSSIKELFSSTGGQGECSSGAHSLSRTSESLACTP